MILFNIVQSADLAVFREDYFNEIIEWAEYGGQWTLAECRAGGGLCRDYIWLPKYFGVSAVKLELVNT